MVEFINDLLNDTKDETEKNIVNMFAAFRGVDFDVDVGCMEKAYNVSCNSFFFFLSLSFLYFFLLSYLISPLCRNLLMLWRLKQSCLRV